MALPHLYNVASSTKSFVSAQHFAQLPHRLIVTPLTFFLAWLGAHVHIAYGVLFLGAYFEALVGPSFFIPGEVFLLSGSILAGSHVLNIWFVAVVLYAGAILGDSSSYWIGRAIGKSLFHEDKKFLSMKNYHKAERLFDKYGHPAIFLARIIGPFSKITPVLAGVFEVPFGTFLLYNIPGVMVGVGGFILVGYLFGNRYDEVLWWVERYSLLFIAAATLLIFGFWFWKKKA